MIVSARHHTDPTRRDARKDQLGRLRRLGQKTGDDHIVRSPVSRLMSNVVHTAVDHGHPIREVQCPDRGTDMVQTAIRSVDEDEFGGGELTGEEHPRNPGARSRIQDPAVPRGTFGRKRGTHRRGEPSGVFPQFFDAGGTQHSSPASGLPGGVERRLLGVSQHHQPAR